MGAQQRHGIATEKLEALATSLSSNIHTGLSSRVAAEKLKLDGHNLLQKAEGKGFLRILREQVNGLNTLVTFSAILCLCRGMSIGGIQFGREPDYVNGTIVLAINIFCIFVGAYMEWSCLQLMADVGSMNSLTCNVLRDGKEQNIDVSLLVVGDVVLLTSGDVVPADCRVLEAVDLSTSEMVLTGEPHEITKTLIPDDTSAPFPSNMLYATTPVVSGTGRGLVTATGMQTEIGKIAESLNVDQEGLTQIQITLNAIATTITIIVVFLVTMVFLISTRLQINDPSDPCEEGDVECFVQKGILRALFCGMGAIPETLPPACMLILVVGVQQMRCVKASVRSIEAVDTIGTCSFICSDKTGTLTEGKMTAICFRPRLRFEGLNDTSFPKSFGLYPTRGYDPAGGAWDERLLTEQVKVALDAIPSEDYSKTLKTTNHGALLSLKEFGRGTLGAGAAGSREQQLLHTCFAAIYLNSYATTLALDPEAEGGYKVKGNMSEAALVVACEKVGVGEDSLHGRYPRLPELEVPFTSSRKMMATLHYLQQHGVFEHLSFSQQESVSEPPSYMAIVKGAPDVLLPRLKAVLKPPSEDGNRFEAAPGFSEDDRKWFEMQNDSLAAQGLRVLCVAACPLDESSVEGFREARSNKQDLLEPLLQKGLVLLGLVGLMDPPRSSVKMALNTCHRAGIRVAMITGDQKPTAVAISKQLGIIPPTAGPEDEHWLASECSALRGLNQDCIDELCSRIRVWSRAQPADKVTIVSSLQRQGHIVAMTGDGTNDAGALKKANIGLAMGIAGSDVAKGASDIVLLDDRFGTIVDAISEGRRIFENIQRMALYLLCGNVFDVVAIIVAMLLGLAVPLEDTQLFKAQFLTHFFYPWVMIYQSSSFYNMLKPPRSRTLPVLSMKWQRILMPATLVLYIGGLLFAQVLGSQLYVGAYSLSEQMGTHSLGDFYGSRSNYLCLYANTLNFEKDTQAYQQDVAPLICRVRRLGWTGFYDIVEWGHHNKQDPEIAVKSGEFDTFQGVWKGDRSFGLDESFLQFSFEGGALSPLDTSWHDPNNWLVKCDNISHVDMNNKTEKGDNDRLCWKSCGKVPCWQLGQNGTSVLRETQASKVHEDEPPFKPVLYKKYNIASWGCRQMRSVVLIAMVLMQTSMLFAFSQHDCAVFNVSHNRTFFAAWVPILTLLSCCVYLPVTWFDQGFAPVDSLGIVVAVSIAASFYFGLEVAKAIYRTYFFIDLVEQIAVAQLLAEGRLRAFCHKAEAFLKCPDRRPMALSSGQGMLTYGTLTGPSSVDSSRSPSVSPKSPYSTITDPAEKV